MENGAHEFQNQGAIEYPPELLLRPPRPRDPLHRQARGPVGQINQDLPDWLQSIIAAVQRKGTFLTLTDTASATPSNPLPTESRTYFVIQNQSAAINLIVGFDTQATLASGGGIVIPAGSAYEPLLVPQNAIWVSASGNCPFTIIRALG